VWWCDLFLGRAVDRGSDEQWEADLNERLPKGSSWEQAHEWFASHGLEASYIADSNKGRVGLMSVIPNYTLLQPGEIQIFLYFDDSGKLRERVIRRIASPV
jgi:hypothetical protein